jgi:hypothetical protein
MKKENQQPDVRPSNPTCDPGQFKRKQKISYARCSAQKESGIVQKETKILQSPATAISVLEGNKKISYGHCTKRIRHRNVHGDHFNLHAAARITPRRQPLDQFVLTGISSTSKLPLAWHRDVRPHDQFDL